MNFIINFVKNEIALSGLSGINYIIFFLKNTGIELNDLWNYLSCSPDFDNIFYKPIDNVEKYLIFQQLFENDDSDIDFYYYDKENFIKNFNKQNSLGISRQIKIDIPGFVSEENPRIQGYCPFYDYLNIISKSELKFNSYVDFENQIKNKYFSNTIVIIASQELREKVIMQGIFVDYKKWSKTFYVLVELLAKSRENGLFQKDCQKYNFNSKTLYFAVKCLSENDILIKCTTHKDSIYFKSDSCIFLKRNYKVEKHLFLKRITENLTVGNKFSLFNVCLYVSKFISSQKDGRITIKNICNVFANNKFKFEVKDIKVILVVLYDLLMIEFYDDQEQMYPEEVLKMFQLPKCKKYKRLELCPYWMRPENAQFSDKNYWNVFVVGKSNSLKQNKSIKTLLMNDAPLLTFSDFKNLKNNTNYYDMIRNNVNHTFREVSLFSMFLGHVCICKEEGLSLNDAVKNLNLHFTIILIFKRIAKNLSNFIIQEKLIKKCHINCFIRKEFLNNNLENKNIELNSVDNLELITNGYDNFKSQPKNNISNVEINNYSIKLQNNVKKLESCIHINRKNQILSYFENDQACLNRLEIQKKLREDEKAAGLEAVISYRSVIRLLKLLVDEKHLQVYSTRIYFKKVINQICLYTKNTVNYDFFIVKQEMYDLVLSTISPYFKEYENVILNLCFFKLFSYIKFH